MCAVSRSFGTIPQSLCCRFRVLGESSSKIVYGVPAGLDSAFVLIGNVFSLHTVDSSYGVWRCTEFVDSLGDPICDGDMFYGKDGLYAVRWVPVLNAFRFVVVGSLCAQPKTWVLHSRDFSNRTLGRVCGSLRLMGHHLKTYRDGIYWCDLTIGSYE